MDFPFVKEAILQLFSKPSCNNYPFEPVEAAPRYRGRIAYDPNKCIGCGMCERVCAGGAITRTMEKLGEEEGDRYTLTFNLGSCTFCSHCADFCAHGAIELTQDYHMVATKEEDLLVTGSFIKVPKKKPAPKAAAAPAAEEKPSSAAAKPGEVVKTIENASCGFFVEGEAKSEPVEPAIVIQPRDDGKPVYDPAKCVYCTLCAKKCPAEAITVDRAAKTWTLDEDKCIACGSCAENCPKNAIII